MSWEQSLEKHKQEFEMENLLGDEVLLLNDRNSIGFQPNRVSMG